MKKLFFYIMLIFVFCALLSCSDMMQKYGDDDEEGENNTSIVLSINDGKAFCYSQNVNLSLVYSNISQISLRESGFSWGITELPFSSRNYVINYLNGEHTIDCAYESFDGVSGIVSDSICFLDRCDAGGAANDIIRTGRAVASDGACNVLFVSSASRIGGKGYVNIFNREPDSWNKRVLAVPVTENISSSFGYSLSSDTSGRVLAVGDPGYSSGKGAVFIFELVSGEYSFLSRIEASDLSLRNFGFAVCVSPSGDVIAATSRGSSTLYGGYAALIEKNMGIWNIVSNIPQPSVLEIPAGESIAEFGSSVSVSDGGTYLIVSDPKYQRYELYPRTCGRIFAYERSGASYTSIGVMNGSNDCYSTLVTGDIFGSSLSINADGSVFSAGASGRNSGYGSVFVFRRIGSSFSLISEVSANAAVNSDGLGFSVDISPNGNSFVAGAPGRTGRGSFLLWSISGGAVSFEKEYTSPDLISGDRFGASLVIGSDGISVVAASPDKDIVSAGDSAGGVYIVRHPY